MSCHTENYNTYKFSLSTIVFKLSDSSKGQSLFPTQNTASSWGIFRKSVYLSLVTVVWQKRIQGIYCFCLHQQWYSALPQHPSNINQLIAPKSPFGWREDTSDCKLSGWAGWSNTMQTGKNPNIFLLIGAFLLRMAPLLPGVFFMRISSASWGRRAAGLREKGCFFMACSAGF